MDILFAAPIRAASLEEPVVRYGYYAVVFSCGFLCRMRPAAAPWVGISESAVNILLLVLSVMLPIFNAMDSILAEELIQEPALFTQVGIANFLIAGSVFLFSFHRSQALLLARLTGRGKRAPPVDD